MKVITICGSMKFQEDMIKVALDLELERNWCVLQCVYKVDARSLTEEDINKMSDTHFKRIDISDGIFVVNKGGYIGNQTKKEIAYALEQGKEVYYLEEV